jgi:hypothetical protein
MQAHASNDTHISVRRRVTALAKNLPIRNADPLATNLGGPVGTVLLNPVSLFALRLRVAQ